MARWSDFEEQYLRDHAGDGAKAIAEALGRTVYSVQWKASSMGVSLLKRWLCPRCGRYSYHPPAKWSGWCRSCSVEHSADSAAMKNRELRAEIAEERRRIKESERRRQAIYADTYRRKRELCKLRELPQSNHK